MSWMAAPAPPIAERTSTSKATLDVSNVRRHAERLLDALVDNGPMTAKQCVQLLDWSRSRFDQALKFAREQVCPELNVAIPAPTPEGGWRYCVTTDWREVEQGASFTLGNVDSRLRAIFRDVSIVLPFVEQGTPEWRRANFLHKHVGNIIRTLEEIG